MSFSSRKFILKNLYVIICFYLKGFWHELKLIKAYKQKIHVVQFYLFLGYFVFTV